MRTSSRRLTLALVVSLALITASPIAFAQTQTLSFAGGDFNTNSPTINAVTPAELPSWSAVIFTAHQFQNDSSLFSVDLLSSSNPAGLAASSSAADAYTQSSGWFQYLRIQLGETGQVYVYFLQNSTSGSPIEVFSCTACWDSNGTSVGTLTTGNEGAINYGAEVFASVSDGFLDVGQINADGSFTNWVTQFGLPSQGLGGTYAVGKTTQGGLTNIGGACGSTYDTGLGKCHATAYNGNGYVQVELDPTGFLNSQVTTGTTNAILEVVPLIVIVAVVGMVVGMLKKFKL
ncbi:MAG TPA: hypothetical protein VJR06_09380 [Nitrososphaerales archaeon]|nr:hypothetical protein [Nitrososphaerales archaeon]